MKGTSGVSLSLPPYGYIKTPEDPRFWVIGPEATAVVQRIYRMALDGYGLAEIAAALEQDGVFNPTYYRRSKGTSRGGSKSTVEPTKWGHTPIKKILTSQEYCGDVINFKSRSKSYKMKKRIENPVENRAIFLNVHEAIIDRPTWERYKISRRGRAANGLLSPRNLAFFPAISNARRAAATSISTSTKATMQTLFADKQNTLHLPGSTEIASLVQYQRFQSSAAHLCSFQALTLVSLLYSAINCSAASSQITSRKGS